MLDTSNKKNDQMKMLYKQKVNDFFFYLYKYLKTELKLTTSLKY